MLQPTTRFSSRVDNYVRFRPRYPKEVLQLLKEECSLEPDWTIADLGSGTGFSSELFLQNGNVV
ncbi:MAG: SAM-dependent methyltransferase, partial [Verrucomicrobiota bacterium]